MSHAITLALGDARWSRRSPVVPLAAITVASMFLLLCLMSGYISTAQEAVDELFKGTRIIPPPTDYNPETGEEFSTPEMPKVYISVFTLYGMQYMLLTIGFIFWPAINLALYAVGHLSTYYSLGTSAAWTGIWLAAVTCAAKALESTKYVWNEEHDMFLRWRNVGITLVFTMVGAGMVLLSGWYLFLSVMVVRGERRKSVEEEKA